MGGRVKVGRGLDCFLFYLVAEHVAHSWLLLTGRPEIAAGIVDVRGVLSEPS